MTLTRAEVDVGGAFSFGQAYVALSRVTGSAGLWMRRDLRPQDVSVSREVLQYHGYQPQTVTVSRGGGGSAAAAASPQPKRAQAVNYPHLPRFFSIFSRFPRDFWLCFLDSWRPDAENGRKMGENGGN